MGIMNFIKKIKDSKDCNPSVSQKYPDVKIISKLEASKMKCVEKKESPYEFFKSLDFTKNLISRGKNRIDCYNQYKSSNLKLNNTQIDNLFKSMQDYVSTTNNEVFIFDQLSSECNEINSNHRQIPPYMQNSTKQKVFTDYGFHERDYRRNHSTSGPTADLSDPLKSAYEFMDNMTHSVDNHINDDASREFNNYLKEQEEINNRFFF